MQEIITNGNIILSGFMGSGKSTIGRRLAAALQMKFVDMDLYIEKQAHMNVREIFAQHGEKHFRTLETEAVRALSSAGNYVIATGGGTLMQPVNVAEFHRGGGTIYFLDVPLAALQERLKNDWRRPLLQTPDRRAVIDKLFKERYPQYLSSADVVVDAGAPTMVVVRRMCALRGVSLPPAAKSAKEPRKTFHKKKKRRTKPNEHHGKPSGKETS